MTGFSINGEGDMTVSSTSEQVNAIISLFCMVVSEFVEFN